MELYRSNVATATAIVFVLLCLCMGSYSVYIRHFSSYEIFKKDTEVLIIDGKHTGKIGKVVHQDRRQLIVETLSGQTVKMWDWHILRMEKVYKYVIENKQQFIAPPKPNPFVIPHGGAI